MAVAHTQSDRNKAIVRVSLLLVAIHSNPSLSGTMSRCRTAAGPPPLPTDVSDYTSVPRALLALHLDYEHLSHAGTQADRAARLWEHHHPDGDQSPDPPSSEDNRTSSDADSPTSEDEDADPPTSGDDSSASSSRYVMGSGLAPCSRHRRRRRGNTPSPPQPLLAARPRRAVGLAPLSPAGGEPLTTLTGTGSIVAGITPTLRELSPSLDLSGKRSFEVSLLISLSYWRNSQWVALRALTLTHVLKNVG